MNLDSILLAVFPQVRDAFDEIDVIERRDGQISFVEVARWLRQADHLTTSRICAPEVAFTKSRSAIACTLISSGRHSHPDLPLITQAEQLLPSSIRGPRNPPHLSPCQAPRQHQGRLPRCLQAVVAARCHRRNREEWRVAHRRGMRWRTEPPWGANASHGWFLNAPTAMTLRIYHCRKKPDTAA